MARHFFLLTVILFLNATLFAQHESLTADRSTLLNDYNAVISRYEVVYEFDIIKDSLRISQHISKEMEILSDYTKAVTNDNIYYDSFSSVQNLKAYTMVPGSKGYEKMPVTSFNESNDSGGGIFYDDSKSIDFVYPSLKKGAKTELSYTLIHNNPHFINKIRFQSYLPVINEKVTVKCNKNIELGFRFFNCDPGFLNYTEYSKGQYNYYIWETKDVIPFKYLSSDNYSILYYSPHIPVFIKEVKLKDTTLTYYSTISDLYKFYYTFISANDSLPSAELTGLVENITRNLNDRDKAKAIYYWVQDNIKYVAYTEGYMGFVPATADEVFRRRFGDCKGKSSLIKKMMEIAGLRAYYAWVGTRELPYTYEELPLPSTDNHMIVAYPKDDTVFILDGTFRFIDFGMYPYSIQGKEALVGVDSTDYFIFRVPVSTADESIVYDSVSVQLSDERVAGEGYRLHSGFNRFELAYAMEGIKPDDYNRRLTSLFSKGNNKFSVDTCTFYSLSEHETPATVFYKFNIADYARKIGNEIYINLNLDRSLSDSKIDTTIRYAPVVNDFQYTEKQITCFRIPDGYEVSYMPGNDVIDNDILSASFRYYEKNGCIILEKKMEYKFLLLENNKIEMWNSTIDRLNSNYRLSLVLRRSDN